MNWGLVVPVLLMGGLFLIAGIRLLSRKPGLVASGWIIGSFLITWVLLSFCVTSIGQGRSWLMMIPIILAVVLSLIALAVGAWLGRASHFLAFNVDEKSLYDSLFATLRKHGIRYEEQRSQIMLTEFKSTIQVHAFSIYPSASLGFLNHRAIPNFRAFIADLRKTLAQEKSSKDAL